MDDCLFCKIINKTIPAEIIYENDRVLAFNDINPQAPTHILIIPKVHIPTLNDLETDHRNLIGELVLVASDLAKELDIADDGYRTNFNCNDSGGQTVYHIHLHLLGGREFGWPPG
jgi:histidine triad (HIT) family protein